MKKAANTRQRILDVSQQLFNEYGVAQTSTNRIAIEMMISPGNLYYHFRNKESIVYDLIEQYRRPVYDLFDPNQSAPIELDELWVSLHLLFEHLWHYRFLHRDLDYCSQLSQRIRHQFKHLVKRQNYTICQRLERLQREGTLPGDIHPATLANNIVLVINYWSSFCQLQNQPITEQLLTQGVYQVISLLANSLHPEDRHAMQALAEQYLATLL